MKHMFCAATIALLGCKSKPPPEPTGYWAFQGPVIEQMLSGPFEPASGGPYVVGQWLFVDGDAKAWSAMNDTYPKDRIAQRPADIGTLLIETRVQKSVAQYQGGVDGIGIEYTIEVIDYKAKKSTGKRSFTSKYLPKRIQRTIGDKTPELATGDNEEIRGWLDGLAAR